MGMTGMAFRLWTFPKLFAVLAVLAIASPGAQASELNRIAAVVNDDAISMLDLQMRMRMIQVTSKLPDTKEVRDRLSAQVLRKMVEERLMAQEAKRLKISISKDEVVKQIATIEQQNRLNAGDLERILKQAGVPMTVMYRQLEAELGWSKVIRMTMLSRIRVSEDEVKDHLEMLQANLGQPEYLLAEIVLPVDRTDREADVAQAAQRIIDELRKGAPFQNMARQFSQSASAAAGGDLEWVPVASLEPEAANVLARMQPGSLSPPIRTIEGYQILLLRDRRLFGQTTGSVDSSEVSLAQLFVPFNGDRVNANRRIREISAGLRNCSQMEEVAKRYRLPQSGRGTAKLAQMTEQARQFINNLKLLQLSQPLEDQNGVRVVMVCGRTEAAPKTEAGLPSAEQIKTQLERQRLELLAQRHLRDLKRAAFIEVKK